MIHIFTFKTYFATNPLTVLFSLEYLETENSIAASACVCPSIHVHGTIRPPLDGL